MRVNQRAIKDNITAYAFIAPGLLLFLAIGVYSIVFSFILSFTTWGGIDFSTARFVGFLNFYNILFYGNPLVSEIFYQALWNNIRLAVFSIAFTIPASMVLAFMIQGIGGRGTTIFRTIYYTPVVAGGVAVLFAWQGLFLPEGTLNTLLRFLRLDFLAVNDGILANPDTALMGIIIVSIWGGIPGTMILYYAGLSSIDKNLYEAAEIDGAGKLAVLTRITWPMLKPITVICIIQAFKGSFQEFGTIYVLTRGGPAYSTEVMGTVIYKIAFSALPGVSGYGLVSAIGWLVFLITLGFSFASLKAMRTDY